MTGRHHAYIFEDDGDFKVRPALATIDRQGPLSEGGDVAFSIRNLTAYRASVRFPGPERPVAAGWAETKSAGWIEPGRVGTIPLTREASGIYRYEVVFETPAGGEPVARARGESGPRVVIDP